MMMHKQTAIIAGGIALGLAALELWKRSRETSFSGQVVLITGGSRGLGLALAREFAAQGSGPLVLCARDAEELARAREDLEARGATVLDIVCDVTDPEQVQSAMALATEKFGSINVLVNNAGIISVGPVQDMTREDFAAAMDADFWGTVYPTLAVLPQMRPRKAGRIVNITSIGGKISVPHLLPYSCAKFAATAFSEGLRAELARDGITVTTITPGLMQTGSYDQAFFKGAQAGEYGWFTVSDNLPGLSMSAERAARQIVGAVRRNEAERAVGLPAVVGAKVFGLAPGLTADILGLVNRALPPPTEGDTQQGRVVREENPSRLRDTLAALGPVAQEKLNQA